MRPEFWFFFSTLALILFLKFGSGKLSGTMLQAITTKLENLLAPSGSDAKKGWWEKKDIDSQRWFLYTALAVIAIVIVYAAPEKWSAYRYTVAGAVVLLGLHLVIWPFYTEKTSLMTKVFITGFLLYFISAFAFPDTVRIGNAGIRIVEANVKKAADQASRYAENLEKGSAASNKSTSVGNVPTKKIALTSDWSEPSYFNPSGGIFRFHCTVPGAKVRIDYTSVQSSTVAPGEEFDCPTPGITRGDINIAQGAGMDTRFYFKSDEDSKGFVIIKNGV